MDNITSIEWNSSDYCKMICFKELSCDEMNVINGFDQILLMGLSAGAHGAIGTTYNFMRDIIKYVYDSFKQKNIEKA